MADYWKDRLDEITKTTTKTSSTKLSSSDYWKTKLKELEEAEKNTDSELAPAKSAAKEEKNDQPLLVQAFQKFGEFTDNVADKVGKIILGETDKKDDEEIAPTVTTAKKEDDGFSLKNAASWAGDVAMSGLASFNKGITSTADVLIGKPLESLGWENNPISKLADYYDEQYTAWRGEKAESEAKLGGGKVLNVLGELGEGAVAAVPNALAALMSAGASLGATTTSTGLQQAALYDSGNLLTKIGMKVTDMVKNPQYWTSFAQTMGTDYEEAKARGASDTAALYGATLSSLINAGVEIGIDGMSGIQGLPAKVMSGDKGAFYEWIESSLSEGGEEMIQGVITNVVSKVLYDDDTKVFDAKAMATDFGMGTAIGGILGGGQIAAVKGADAVNNAMQTNEDNKLTENEQKVVDKVYEDRIAEAEKDGEKLTVKEKNKIYEEVENDLEKGYISTDTIEEVLGGETYAEYKNTTESENALREEYEALGAMKKSDFTAKQDDRYNELKQKLAEIESGDARNQLKTKLSGEVFSLTEGSRLAESYNERARRGEKFDADLTAYDEKQKAVVQKAIDSGILNNTNRTHEFVDMVAKISADKGVLFDFTNNTKLKDSGFAVDGKTVNGFVNQDGVTVNIDSAKSLNSVVGHEITHVLEGTELYTELQNAVVEYAKTKGDYQGRYDSLAELYKGIEGADIDAELTADLIGDYLFTDADFVSNLSVTNRNVFQKIYDEVKYLVKVATAGSKEARELAKVKRAFDKAYKSGGKVAQTKYSVSDKNIKDVSTGYGYGETYFTMSYTQDGKVVGTLEYGEYDGEANVKMIQVLPEYRRRGIGTKLMQELQKKYPDTEIDFGMSTPDGTNLLNAITYDVTDEAVASDRQKLTDLQTELNELQGKLDVLYDTENLTEAQDKELHELGDRWQEVYEAIGKLEKDLRGKRATKTFVKTDAKYSLSDSDGKQLTAEQGEYFKDSKVRDENGNLKVMYHGSQDAGFHEFDASMSDDGASFFFVDRNDVAASYSGTTETYEAKTIRTAEDMNNFLAEIGYDQYEAVEEGGKFVLYENGEYVAKSDTAQGIYEEFCWYEGVGEGDANYKVYLNLKNPLVVDAEGRNWNNITREFSQEIADRYHSLTVEEKAALTNLAEWGEYGIFKEEMLDARAAAEQGVSSGFGDVEFTKTLARAYAKLGGANANLYDAFSIASDNFSAESIQEFAVKQMNTRDYAKKAKAEGYDGVIFKNIVDNGGYSNGSEGASTVAIAFDSEQIKSVANEKPTTNKDIRYSLSGKGDTAKKHGRYHIKGEDVALDVAPVQDVAQDNVQDIAPVAEESAKPKERRLAWYNRYGDKVADVPVMEDIAPSEPSLPQLRRELEGVAAKAQEAMNAGDAEALNALGQRYEELNQQIHSMEADEAARVSSIDDADAPPEVDAPYYGESEAVMPDDPFEGRDPKKVKDEKSYMYENPEVKPFFQAEANILLGELDRTDKAQTYYNGWIKQDMSYEFAQDIPEVYRTSRVTSPSIAALRDDYGMSYDDIRKGLNALIEDHGAENIAAAKRIEFEINDRLMKGYQDDMGNDIPANAEYLNLLNEKQISAYSDEARRSFFESVGATKIAPVRAMDDIAPVGDTVKKGEIPGQQTMLAETIRPQRQSGEPRMIKVKDGETSPDGKERKWYGTSTSSEAVGGLVTPEDIPDDVRYYQVKPNKQTLAVANARLEKDGYAKSREYFEGRMSAKKLTVEDIALGERLIQEAAKAGDAKAVRDLIIDVSILGTELGQRVQALSIIRRLTPEGQLKALQRTIDRAKSKGDKAFDGVELTEDMAKTITDTIKEDGTFDQGELNAAVEDVKQQIADQMSTSALDYVNAWRYLAMLGNPKTHIRNIVSNVAMYGTRAVKNVVARTAEDIILRKAKPTLVTDDIAPYIGDAEKKGEVKGQQTVFHEDKPTRTKTWKRSTDAVKEFAKETTKDMATVIMGENKYSEAGSIKEMRNVFKTRIGNALNNANTTAMEWEDAIFSKSVYRRTLQEYLTANGVKTEADIKNNPALVEKAKEYALDESRRATFRQDSYLANKIHEVEQKNPIYGIAIGSTIPFKRTPINVAKAGISYSPLGFARNIYDAVQVKRGNMDASEAIDHLAQTLTGTSLTLIGFALANSGILNGAGDDDKEGKYDYQLGEQSYSFNFGGNTFSLSWLSPVAMPLFVGVNAYEKLVEKSEWDTDVVIDTLAQTLDPLSEMSFLSSLDDVLSSYDSGIEKFMGMGKSMLQNYATQFIPTLSSQIAATADDVKRSTKASGTSDFETGDGFLRQMAYKIPGLRNKLEPTTDIWGNEYKQTENVFARAFESFLSPANKREGISTAVDEELKSLYRETGDATLIPSIPYDYTNYKGVKYDMSAEEYTAYKQTYGQTALDLMDQLFATNTYRSATAEERADMVGRVYDYAMDAAKLEYFDGIDLDYTNAEEDNKEVFKENPIKGAIEADLPVDEYVFSMEYPDKYKFFNENGISYDTYKAADEDGKRAYTWAYENPGKFTMSKAISDDFMEYYGYKSDMSDFNAKDENGESVSGLKKERVIDYVNGLNLDYGQKIILFRSMYDSKADQEAYNQDIVDYLNEREDISYSEMETILKELGFEVDSDGNISW